MTHAIPSTYRTGTVPYGLACQAFALQHFNALPLACTQITSLFNRDGNGSHRFLEKSELILAKDSKTEFLSYSVQNDSHKNRFVKICTTSLNDAVQQL